MDNPGRTALKGHRKINYTDNSLKPEGILAHLEKIPIIGKFSLSIADFFFYFVRSLLSISKKKTGNLVIISFHRLGDTVFTIPAIKEVFGNYSNYNKKILCYPDSEKIYRIVFEEEIAALKKSDFKFGTRIASPFARKKLKDLNPEVIYDLTGTITSASLIFNSKAAEISGMNERIFKKLYNHYTTRRKEPHLIDTYLDAVSTNIKIEDRDHIKQFKSFVDPKGNILILPFAIRKAKEWNLTKYLTLAEQLNEDYNIKIISAENFIDGDVEADIRNNRIPFAVTRTLDELINEIKNSSVFISNDTGPLYIANLLGKPTFTIYGPTNPDYSLPFGNNHMYIREKINCTPDKAQYCFTEAGTYCPVYNCMNLLSVEKVYNKLISFLQSLSINRKSNFKG